MAKKKATKRRTVKKATPKSSVSKTQEIKNALAATPDKSPKEIADALTARGVDVSANYVSNIKSSLKAGPSAPKRTTKKKVAAKKKPVKRKAAAKKKVAPKKAAPTKAPVEAITYKQLSMAKELAQKLGGVEKAKQTLAALSNLVG